MPMDGNEDEIISHQIIILVKCSMLAEETETMHGTHGQCGITLRRGNDIGGGDLLISTSELRNVHGQ